MTKLPLTLRNRESTKHSKQSRPSDPTYSAITTTTTTSDTKTPSDSAMLAQRLASESSWADRYVPVTPDETVMTPSTPSMTAYGADHQEDEPPTYESATSTTNSNAQSPGEHFPPTDSQQDIIQPESASQVSPRPRPSIFDGHYSRHETHHGINGTFTLRDSLELSTTSGSISIRLDVKPGPHPAILKLKTQSGSIRVDDKQCDVAQDRSRSSSKKKLVRASSGSSRGFRWGFGKRSDTESENEISPVTTSDDPRKQPGQQQETDADDDTFTARVIHTIIETSSGSVGGHLILTPGSETRIKTNSGSIGLKLLSTGSGSKTKTLSKLEREYAHTAGRDASSDLRSIVDTTSNSGSQNISISSSLSDTSEGAIISAVQAKHYTTGSASLHIHYPQEWCGLVHTSVGGSGRCWVRGHGLEYEKRGKQEIFAWRNVDVEHAEVSVEVRSDGSGSIGFSC